MPQELCVCALRCLAVQLADRGRQWTVLNALNTGGSSGILAVMLHRVVEELNGTAPASEGRRAPWCAVAGLVGLQCCVSLGIVLGVVDG